MARIGKCKCDGELSLSVVALVEEGVSKPTAFCKKCFKEYPVEMVGKSHNYTKVKK
ncbi:hypothetical protein LCGC14_2160690 [marine sediment metagenome]|uniref:Uncharacterized protein n=1 Tax=marine sediment metagenome TaxID=412755 RepID=A0A0F9DT05_9ZZZZ